MQNLIEILWKCFPIFLLTLNEAPYYSYFWFGTMGKWKLIMILKLEVVNEKGIREGVIFSPEIILPFWCPLFIVPLIHASKSVFYLK